MDYNTRDYSGKTPEEWFAEKCWSGFLMTIPLGKRMVVKCENVFDINTLRSTASMLQKRTTVDRKFSITTDKDVMTNGLIIVEANGKNNGTV